MKVISASTPTYVDLRCPIGPKRLLGKVRQRGDQAKIVAGNLLELACKNCRDSLIQADGTKPKNVVHRFNVLGELIESEAIWL